MKKSELKEQRLLLLSAGATILLATAGIVIGLMSGAKSIVFDGMYSMIDAAMTVGAYFVARLIASGGDRRFQYGYWHLEPMLGLVNGSILLFACIYAFTDGLGTMLMGGRDIEVGPGIIYAALSAAICLAFHLFVRAQNKGLGSMLLRLDSRAWLFSGLLNAGIFAAFVTAYFLKDTSVQRISRLVDPAILILLAIGMVPVQVRALIDAGKQVLQVAPVDLDAQVDRIAADVANRYGFVEFRSYVSRVGRARFIEIGFVGAQPATATTFGELDVIRAEVADAMGGLQPGYWLTIDFTADRRWI